jgi:hypothetical protein
VATKDHEQVRERTVSEPDLDLEHARALYNRACLEFMDSVRKDHRNDDWLGLANAIFSVWPEVDPDAKPHMDEVLRAVREPKQELLAWLDEPDLQNELRLRKAARAYFGRQ